MKEFSYDMKKKTKLFPVFMSSDNKNAVRQTTKFMPSVSFFFRVQYEYMNEKDSYTPLSCHP